jgi:ubiquinone/menaquinone biosynthesis C-methylase UbiE
MKKYFPNSYLVGIDIDSQTLSASKAKYDEVIVASAYHLPFREKSFDYSACIDVIDLPELRERRRNVIMEIERVTRRSAFYHLFNGKTGPLKELVGIYGKVGYIGRKERSADGYRKRYRYQKEWFKKLLSIEDREIKRDLRILRSLAPSIEREKLSLGSYLIEVDF